jgi:hypothetical protein
VFLKDEKKNKNKNDGIALYVPKDIIMKEMAAKIE